MQTTMNIDSKLAQALEFSEATYWSKYYNKNSYLKTLWTVTGGAFAGAVPDLDVLALNRVIGLGLDRAVTSEDLDYLVRFFKSAGSRRFFIQLSPLIEQSDLPDLLSQKGFRPYNRWAKLIRSLQVPVPTVPNSKLEVIQISEKQADLYGQIIFDSFNWQDKRMTSWLAASVGKSGYRHYLVYLEGKAIAAGALYIHQEYASMAFAGTLPAYRGLGAQRLLLQTRLQQAKDMGCQYAFSETAEDKPERPVQSFRNMLKLGFEPAYLRENWIYEM